MKKSTIILLLTIYVLGVKAQKVDQKTTFAIAKMNVGYSPVHNSPIAGLEAGVRTGDIYLGANLITSPLRNLQDAPISTGLILGYNLGSFQPFLSSDLQSVGRENEASLKGTKYEFKNGMKFGGGLSYYLPNIPLCFTAKFEGKEVSVMAGMYVSF